MLSTKVSFPAALTVAGLTLSFLSGCSSSVHAPDVATKNAANSEISKNLVDSKKANDSSIPSTKVDAAPGSNFSPESPDMKAETEVDDKLLVAWRLAVKGKEEESLKMMSTLEKKFPKFKTIAAMHAQILDHFGRKQEALKFYEEATSGNDFDMLHTFKMARAYRTSGDTKTAIEKYRKLVKEAPDFPPGKFELAQALLSQDSNSAEARKLLSDLNADDRAKLEADQAAEESAQKSAKAAKTGGDSRTKEVTKSK